MIWVFCSGKLPQPLLTNIPLSSSRKMDSHRTTVVCPQPGRSSLFGISTTCFYLQLISGHLRTQGIKQIPKLYLPHFTLSGCLSQYLPPALAPWSMHLPMAAQILSTILVPHSYSTFPSLFFSSFHPLYLPVLIFSYSAPVLLKHLIHPSQY